MDTNSHGKLVRAPKLSEQITKLLMNEIMDGSIKVGEQLPSEIDLCSRYDVSRTIIREATGRLEHDGFLDVKRGRRAVVTHPAQRKAFRIEEISSMDTSEFAQIYQFRVIIECAAVALMIKSMNKDSLEKLKSCVEKMEESYLQRGEAIDQPNMDETTVNVEFHQLIAEGSGNKFLRDFMLFLNDKLSNMLLLDFKELIKQGALTAVHEEHKAIYKAIEAEDIVSAKQCVFNHILNAARRHGIELEDIFD
jgi:DNA-binding FadR family transcriptional regulator